jgi:hypothetical protein
MLTSWKATGTIFRKPKVLRTGELRTGKRLYRFTIIESRRRHGVESHTFLHDVLTRLPSMTNHQIKDIVPKAWATARKSTALKAA